MKKVEKVVDLLLSKDPSRTEYKKSELVDASIELGYNDGSSLTKHLIYVSRGVYDISGVIVPIRVNEKPALNQRTEDIQTPNVSSFKISYIPSIDKDFVKWGAYKDVLKIIKSEFFYPIYITGLSGNGKTMMVEQAAANAKREFIRVQISPETDQDDLIGGFRLVN